MKKVGNLVKSFVAVAVLASFIPANASATTVDQGLGKQTAPAHATDRVIVKMKAGKDVNGLVSKHGAKSAKALVQDWKVLNVPAGKADEFLTKLQGDADVAAVELDYVMYADTTTPNDPSYPSQYHLPKIQANLAWDITKGSSSRTVAIIDTGVDLNHTDLAGKFVAGYDYVNLDTVAQDDHGHGTHCAGIAAGLTNNGLSTAGVDWNAKIMPIKVLNSAGSGYTTDIINGVNFAASNGANVISMSLGGGSFSSAFQSAIDNAWNSGLIIVAAAGNSSSSVKSYPAAYNNVIAVASTDSNDVISYFSNYGNWVDVAAPGSSILSLKLGGGTTTMSGTSMACPVVAGLATLAWSKNLTYSNTTVRDRIFTTSDAITGTGTKWTYGRVNAYRAVNGF